MSLEKIVSKVEQDSKAAEQAILKEAARSRSELLAQAKQTRDEILSGYRQKADRTIAQMRTREEAGLEMEVKKRMLASRRKVLDSAFLGVMEHFANLPAASKKKIYAALMDSASRDLPRGKVRCVKGEESLFSGFPAYEKGAPIEGAGGFILESQDGRLEIDMRFEVLLKDIWDRNLGEISARLFDEGAPR
jgi:V/A-type H+-transporting ATPase subunit E